MRAADCGRNCAGRRMRSPFRSFMTSPTKITRHKVLLAGIPARSEVLRGIGRFAGQHGWQLVVDVLFGREIPSHVVCDGVLFLASDDVWMTRAREWKAPAVAVALSGKIRDAISVESDHRAAGRMAASHLLHRGYRHFALAPARDDEAERECFAAFRECVVETCGTGDFWPAPSPGLRPELPGRAHGSSADALYNDATFAQMLRRMPRPSAVFAGDDGLAANIISLCLELGLNIPEEVAVLGLGNTTLCETFPVPLSSVDLDYEGMGFTAARALHDILEQATSCPSSIRVAPKAVESRASTSIVSASNSRVVRALAYIAEHFTNPRLTVADVAFAVGMSRRNLERSFRHEMGVSVNRHIVATRMREAAQLLHARPGLRSAEVAMRVGIAETRTFFRTFRRYYGMSPKEHCEWAVKDPRSAA
jgi:LacI family transcriptional regulator